MLFQSTKVFSWSFTIVNIVCSWSDQVTVYFFLFYVLYVQFSKNVFIYIVF